MQTLANMQVALRRHYFSGGTSVPRMGAPRGSSPHPQQPLPDGSARENKKVR